MKRGTDADADYKGIECKKCGCRHFEVVRTVKAILGIRRVRECRNCGERVTTSERVDPKSPRK